MVERKHKNIWNSPISHTFLSICNDLEYNYLVNLKKIAIFAAVINKVVL